MSFATEAAKPFWEGAFVFGKRRVLRGVSLVKPPAFSLSARLKKYINDGGDSYPSLVESAQDFSDAPFLAHGSICSRNMHHRHTLASIIIIIIDHHHHAILLAFLYFALSLLFACFFDSLLKKHNKTF